eukprot:Gb_25505 [translate_table: standard]
MSARVPENCEDGAIYDQKTISHISSRLSSCSADELMSPVVEEGIPMLVINWTTIKFQAFYFEVAIMQFHAHLNTQNQIETSASERVHSPRSSEWQVVDEKQRIMELSPLKVQWVSFEVGIDCMLHTSLSSSNVPAEILMMQLGCWVALLSAKLGACNWRIACSMTH